MPKAILNSHGPLNQLVKKLVLVQNTVNVVEKISMQQKMKQKL